MTTTDIIIKVERDGITVTQAIQELARELNLTLSTKQQQELIHNAVAALC